MSMGELLDLLRRWGAWMEVHRNDHSAPKAWVTANIPSGEVGQHKILCAEMDPEISRIHRHIFRLKSMQRQLLEIWYGMHLDGEGRFLSVEQKAKRLRMSRSALKARVHYARKNLLRILQP